MLDLARATQSAMRLEELFEDRSMLVVKERILATRFSEFISTRA